MLRFSVFDERGPAKDWALVNAHLLGADDTALAGAIAFRGGLVACRPLDPHLAHALCMEVDAGPAGRMMLQTCLLQQREEPYRLYEELARQRIKLFLEKSENWGLLDPAKAPEAFELFERARSQFVTGMVEQDPFRAQQRHQEALAVAVFASEKLVMRRAEWMLHARFGKQGTQRSLGVRAPLEKAPELFRSALSREFDIISVPTPWSLIEPSQGRFTWDQVDRWMAWAKQSGRQIIAGPLLDCTAGGVPGWVRPSLGDPSRLKDRLFAFVNEVVTRYGPLGPIWNVATGVHLNEEVHLSGEAMVQVTRMAGVAARQVRKDARLLVEVGDPFSVLTPGDEGSVGAIRYIRALVAEGVPMDLVGVPVVLGEPGRGRGTRDLMQVAAMLERFTSRKEMPPILVTACGAPSAPHADPGAGWWREPWSPRAQGAWAAMVFRIAMANPGIHAVVWDRLRDDSGAGLRDGGLFGSDGSPKPAAERLLVTRKKLRSPLGPAPSVGTAVTAQAQPASGDE